MIIPSDPPEIVSPSNPVDNLPNGTVIDPQIPTNPTTESPNGTITPTTIVNTTNSSELYRVYECTLSDINRIGSILWSQEYLENVLKVNTNPIENILSLKMTCIGLSASSIAPITLGNIVTDVIAGVITENYSITLGTFTLLPKYNSFLDITPFTTYEIYLPFVGYRELNSNDVLNNEIAVNMVVDVLTLMCKYQLVRVRDNLIVAEYEFYIAVDLPISASNMLEAKFQKMGNLMESVLSIPEFDFSGVATGLMSAITTQTHTTTTGNASANTGLLTSRKIYTKITRPMWQDIELFNHTVGRVCNMDYVLGSLQGFTKVRSDCDLSGIPCTADEMTMIRDLLTNGVYL